MDMYSRTSGELSQQTSEEAIQAAIENDRILVSAILALHQELTSDERLALVIDLSHLGAYNPNLVRYSSLTISTHL